MHYEIIYVCQNCKARFYEVVHRDEIVDAMKHHFCDALLPKDLFHQNSFLITLFQKGGELHNCELDVVGHGKVVGLMKKEMGP